MSRTVPSPRALLVFEAAARAGSFTAAASEFNVSQPSISRAIAQLEGALGVRLFDRQARGLALTPEGSELYAAVTDGFGRIGASVRSIQARSQNAKPVITLSLSTSFVAHWLLPRLGEFYAAFPQVDLRFDLIAGAMRGIPDNVDLATRIDPQDDARYHRWPLAPEIILPVCSPSYAKARGPLNRDGEGHVFLHLSDHSPDEWKAFRRDGHSAVFPKGAWHEFTDYAVILQAALNGEGIALGWVSVVSSALVKGAFIPATELRSITGRHHCLLAPKNRPLSPVTIEIANWLATRMAHELSQLWQVLGLSNRQ
ncbi:LysR substrate-binding domain-containing protein [Alsobacter sp. KACC 23698]|uniref:LysR substrate-binding domain-containing protein n=1 Tax=Alsobacter sp. KACC 23698 TaxID=3149229 RepID=A0AAU7JLV8_9HYPH